MCICIYVCIKKVRCMLTRRVFSLEPLNHLELSLGSSGDGTLDQTIGIALWGVDSSVLASVLKTMMPREIYFEIVLIRKSVAYIGKLRNCFQNEIGHVVHGGLNRCRVLQSKSLECNVSSTIEGNIKLAGQCLDLSKSLGLGSRPCPSSIDISRKNSVVSIFENGEVTGVETMEHGTSALQNRQSLEARNNGERIRLLLFRDLAHSGLGSILHETVRVGLALDIVSSPSVLGDFSSGTVDPAVFIEEMVDQSGSKSLNWPDIVLLSENVDGLLDSISRNNRGIIGLGIGLLDFTFQENTNSDFANLLMLRVRRVSPNFEKTDVIFSVGRSSKRHCSE